MDFEPNWQSLAVPDQEMAVIQCDIITMRKNWKEAAGKLSLFVLEESMMQKTPGNEQDTGRTKGSLLMA